MLLREPGDRRHARAQWGLHAKPHTTAVHALQSSPNLSRISFRGQVTSRRLMTIAHGLSATKGLTKKCTQTSIIHHPPWRRQQAAQQAPRTLRYSAAAATQLQLAVPTAACTLHLRLMHSLAVHKRRRLVPQAYACSIASRDPRLATHGKRPMAWFAGPAAKSCCRTAWVHCSLFAPLPTMHGRHTRLLPHWSIRQAS
jgi:hypothetical protein